MYLLQEHHAASKAGQALKLNSRGLREWCYCFFLQLQALHFDTGLLFPQAEKYELRQNWKKTQLPHHCLQPVGNGPVTPADTALKGCPLLQEGTAGTARCSAPPTPHTAPASLLLLLMEHGIVSTRKTGTRRGHQQRAVEATITNRKNSVSHFTTIEGMSGITPAHRLPKETVALHQLQNLHFVTEWDGNRNLSDRMSKIETLYCFTALLTVDTQF